MKPALPVIAVLCVCLRLGAAGQPDIIFIVADDPGCGEPGCYGGTEIPTPHIDSLARHGARFANGYVTAPFCAASRAALLTGRYQTRFGFDDPPGMSHAEAHRAAAARAIGGPCSIRTGPGLPGRSGSGSRKPRVPGSSAERKRTSSPHPGA